MDQGTGTMSWERLTLSRAMNTENIKGVGCILDYDSFGSF
jgi:hypothetical protein